MPSEWRVQLTLAAAQALRDGGIDACAALSEALHRVLDHLPAEQAPAVKHAMGRALAAVLAETVEPAVKAFPELDPDDATWQAVVRATAKARASE